VPRLAVKADTGIGTPTGIHTRAHTCTSIQGIYDAFAECQMGRPRPKMSKPFIPRLAVKADTGIGTPTGIYIYLGLLLRLTQA